jgi:uncharacterized protein
MVKEPRAGRVKTRLGADIGMVQSAWWFRHQAARLVRRLMRDPRWQCVLAVAPDVEGLASRVWPANVVRIAQGTGDLGQRMARLFRELPVGPVVIVGADIPAIEPRHIARAFRALGDHDAVFGPAEDGGYWLIGLKRMRSLPPCLLGKVRWSGKHALADSEAGLKDMRIARIDMLRDVDRAADL